MPRASRAISLATRWRFIYLLCSHKQAEASSKDAWSILSACTVVRSSLSSGIVRELASRYRIIGESRLCLHAHRGRMVYRDGYDGKAWQRECEMPRKLS